MSNEAFVFPTSYAQQRLWFLDQLVPVNAFYNVDVALRIRRDIRPDVLQRAVNETIRRHESLRTVFRAVRGEPAQVVLPELEIDLRLEDLSAMEHEEREREVERLATEEARRPFDLSKAPLIRTTLVRLSGAESVLLLTMHHIVCDGWSMGIFYEELSTVYDAFAAGEPSPLPELPIQYADFAVAQREWIEGSEAQAHLVYWKRRLADLPVLRLPTDRPRPPVASYTGARHNLHVPARLHAALRALSQAEGATMFMTLLAAFHLLLYRYTGQQDLATGTPVANRTRGEVENLIGFFVNALVFRSDLSGSPTFRELLARVRVAALEAYEHQELPFEKLVQELQPERDFGVNPLFQVSFQLFSLGETTGEGTGDAGELFGSPPLEVERGTANIDFALDMWELADGIWGVIEYSTDQFDAATVGGMAEHFLTLLEGIATDPDRRLSEYSILSRAEWAQIVVDWNDTVTPVPVQACLHTLFEEQVERTPDSVAVVFRNEVLTYRELDRSANQLSAFLRASGLGPESIVAICTERSLEMIVGLFGILKAGCAYLPIDPAYPKERLAFLLDDARPALLLTQRRFQDRFPAYPVRMLCLDTEWNAVAGFSDAPAAIAVSPENLCYVIYTSGTTGTPKGVMVEHRTVCNHLLWMQATVPLTEADIIPQKYSLSFDASIWEIFGPLIAGARLTIAEPGEHLDIPQLALLCSQSRITVIDLVPSLLEALLDDANFLACRSLRRITCGGERLSMELQERCLGSVSAELRNVYGPTEATIGATAWVCRREYSDHVVPIGRPAANTFIYLLDRDLNPVPAGVAGELYIGGACLARGYRNRPEWTIEKFIADPFGTAPGARLYRTGDLARYLRDGNIEYLGRVDHQVKILGHRIELGEIEARLDRHSSVRACAVTIREDETGKSKLVAYVVPETNRPELWPSLGEYSVYDDVLYYAMTHDERRNASYRAAIDRLVPGKVVLDIGTGADAVLARFCLDAGAKRVYAIEALDHAYVKARELIGRLGLSGKITIIHGDSTAVELPEPVDVCVSELLGTIGSSEGVIPILNDARRFLRRGGSVIPLRCVTRIAAVSLPDELAGHPKFAESPMRYVDEVFKKFGSPFDLRVCIKNFPQDHIVSTAEVFEDLDFSEPIEPGHQAQQALRISRASKVDGFLLWLNLYPSEDGLIDVLVGQSNWLPIFLPAFYPGLELAEGDVIEVVSSRIHSSDTVMPDYQLEGRVVRKDGTDVVFTYDSPFRETSFCGNPFYEALFGGGWIPQSGDDPLGRAGAEQISHWRRVFDELYGQPSPNGDMSLNAAGWTSSYTGKPIPLDEVREQVDRTVARVLSLAPKRILEIGCGAGSLLFRVAPQSEYYVGTDFSPVCLARVRQQLAARELRRVSLLERPAENFDGLRAEVFDTVILNSVIQYFPTVDYLMRVLEQAIDSVAAGGHIFIGDVRSLALREAFHESVELYRAPPSLTIKELKSRVRKRMSQDQELALDPSFFPMVKQRFAAVRSVEVQPKRGWSDNEFTRFAYDVMLHVGGDDGGTPECEWLHWRDVSCVAALRDILVRRDPVALGVRGIPSARLNSGIVASRALKDPDCPYTVAEFREIVKQKLPNPGVAPEEVYSLADELHYDVAMGWVGLGGEGWHDIVLQRRTDGSPRCAIDLGAAEELSPKPWNRYANNPLQRKSAHGLTPVLRSYLQNNLPEHMIPAAFVMMDELPLTPSGKVDRRALPAPGQARPDLEEAHVLPRNRAEELLADIWMQLLGLETVGVNDNFFELGGDSILSIQVVARASQAGLRFTPAQLFQHQTIAALAAVTETTQEIQADQGPISGRVPLTPVQNWFFEQDLAEPHHYNQSILFQTPRTLQADRVAAVMDELLSHHDALRMRFVRDGSAWQQSIAPAGERAWLTRYDLSAFPESEQASEIERTAAELQASLNLADGPLLRVALYDLGESRPGRLLFVIHHLVVDGVSWRVLLEDFDTVYRLLEQGEPVRLPARTTSFQHWAERLAQYARSRALEAERGYWTRLGGSVVAPLPRDRAGESNTVGSSRSVGVKLSVDESRELLQEVPKAYHTQINDVLLTALVEAFAEWTGERRLLIDLEGHGREGLFEGVDLTRTVGWFTSIFPVLLDPGDTAELGETLQSVKEQLRQVPNHGIGFGILRYPSGEGGAAEELRLPQAEIVFNYLGQYGSEGSDEGAWKTARESAGSNYSPLGKRSHLIEINGSVFEGRLEMDWSYSEDVHRRSTIERLAGDYMTALRMLIRHCRSQEARRYTPSDFAKAKISQKDLDKLISKLRGANDPR
jgi:amino acid adenylation domain-containing protein/non-ribosomal peptide synthase protein (TIGR01720 family)